MECVSQVSPNFSQSTIKDVLNYGFHQGNIPLTTPTIHFRVSDLILDIALIVPYIQGYWRSNILSWLATIIQKNTYVMV